MSDLDNALRTFEATEANLTKIERLAKKIEELTPNGIVFGSNHTYEDAVRSYEIILASLPKIDGWKPQSIPNDLDAIAQWRLDAQDIDEPMMMFDVQRSIEEPSRELREYRFRFDRKRRELIRNAIQELMDKFTHTLSSFYEKNKGRRSNTKLANYPQWDILKDLVTQIDTLIGSSVPRPNRWDDLNRHLHFGLVHDLIDIVELDWPEVNAGLIKKLFTMDEPLPIDVEDLTTIVSAKPTGTVATALLWNRLSAGDFERLIFSLINNEVGYENPEWLMATSAPDRGRDISVMRVIKDQLTGIRSERIIIQCKHWLSRSVSTSDISTLRDQIKLWEPPRIAELIIATSGRFSADAVALVERNNQSDTSLKIQMWSESHLERLLASRPALVAEFGLR